MVAGERRRPMGPWSWLLLVTTLPLLLPLTAAFSAMIVIVVAAASPVVLLSQLWKPAARAGYDGVAYVDDEGRMSVP